MSTFAKMLASSLVIAALGVSSTVGAGAPVVTQFDNRQMTAVLDFVDGCNSTEIVVIGLDNLSHQNGGVQLVFKQVIVSLFTSNSCDNTFSTGNGFVDPPAASVQVAANGSQGSLSASFLMDIITTFPDQTTTTTTVPVSVTLAMTATGGPTVTKTHKRQPGSQSRDTEFKVFAIPTGGVSINNSPLISLAPAVAFFLLNSGGSVLKP